MSSTAGVAFFDSIADEVRVVMDGENFRVQDACDVVLKRVTNDQQAVVIYQALCSLYPRGFELDVARSIELNQSPREMLCDLAVPFVLQRAQRHLDEVPMSA